MKLGLVSAILDWMSFEEMIDMISNLGFDCVEVACGPAGRQSAGMPESAILMWMAWMMRRLPA